MHHTEKTNPSHFRFEYLWPFWLLVRSIYDSFKYQGLVSFSVRKEDNQSNIILL